jgi:hypothetical protein
MLANIFPLLRKSLTYKKVSKSAAKLLNMVSLRLEVYDKHSSLLNTSVNFTKKYFAEWAAGDICQNILRLSVKITFFWKYI